MQAAVERFAGALTVVALLVAAATLVALVRGRVPDWLRDELALPTAAIITGVATVGSLWMSEVASYAPCVLCWYQRIAMYPLPLVLGIAAWRGDQQIRWTVVPLASIGAAISVWHLVVERVPGIGGPCDPVAPCTVRWVEEFGVLTLPAMALVGFLAAIVLALAAAPSRR